MVNSRPALHSVTVIRVAIKVTNFIAIQAILMATTSIIIIVQLAFFPYIFVILS